MKYFVTLRGRTWEIGIAGSRVTLNGAEHSAELCGVEGTPLRLLLVEGRSWSFPMESKGRGIWQVQALGEQFEAEVLDERGAHIKSLGGTAPSRSGQRSLRAPMPGLVVRVLVEPGQKVLEGASLIVLEAMKMENELKAAAPGVVARVTATPGRSVEKGDLLIEFQSTE